MQDLSFIRLLSFQTHGDRWRVKEVQRSVPSMSMSRVTWQSTYALLYQAKMNLTVQEEVVRNFWEGEHPEGETACCIKTILKDFHSGIFRVSAFVDNQIPANMIFGIINRCGPAVVQNCCDMVSIHSFHLNSHIYLLVQLYLHLPVIWANELCIMVGNHVDLVRALASRKFLTYHTAFGSETHGRRYGLDQRVRTRKCNVHPYLSWNDAVVSVRRVRLNGVLVDEVSTVALWGSEQM